MNSKKYSSIESNPQFWGNKDGIEANHGLTDSVQEDSKRSHKHHEINDQCSLYIRN